MLPLASALGLGMLAGARLYATVFVLGVLIRFDWMTLPAAWQQASVLADGRVLAVSGIACLVEFIADKIPWIDSAWDAVHTFIRPIGAVLLTSSLFSNLEPAYQVLLFLLAGGVALTGHSAKAAARLTVNHSPEPFSNAGLSLAEDAFTVAGLYMLVAHPWVLAGIVLAFLGVCGWLLPRIYRALRAEWTAFGALLRSQFGDGREPQLTLAQSHRLGKSGFGVTPEALFDVIATGDVKGLRNAVGTLCLTGAEAVFVSRRWGRRGAVRIDARGGMEARKGLLLDELTLVSADGARTRFDLLAGQLQRARDEAARRSSP